MFFTNRGRVYSPRAMKSRRGAARGDGDCQPAPAHRRREVTAMIPLPRESEGKYLTMATRFGLIKKTALDEFANLRKGRA